MFSEGSDKVKYDVTQIRDLITHIRAGNALCRHDLGFRLPELLEELVRHLEMNMGNPAPTMIDTPDIPLNAAHSGETVPPVELDRSAAKDQERFLLLCRIGLAGNSGNESFMSEDAKTTMIRLDGCKSTDEVRAVLDSHVWPPIPPSAVG